MIWKYKRDHTSVVDWPKEPVISREYVTVFEYRPIKADEGLYWEYEYFIAESDDGRDFHWYRWVYDDDLDGLLKAHYDVYSFEK